MKYFIEELHTKNEWVYKRSHTLLLSVIFTSILFIGAIIFIIIGVNLQIVNQIGLGISTFIGVLLDFLIAFSVIQWLGKGWEIYRRQLVATILKRNINATIDGLGSQIIKIPKKRY